MNNSYEFDVFLSHNSKDKLFVQQVAEALKARDISVWLDECELIPGQPWQEALERVIKTTRSAAVLVGANGLGPWEVPEMRAALSEFVNRGLPVIPILLPGASEKPELPLFLRAFTWVDMRGGVTDSVVDRLVAGIRIEKPPQPSTPANESPALTPQQQQPAPRPEAPRTYSLRLVVNRSKTTYSAKWIEPEGRESEAFKLKLPLAAKEIAELRWYLEEYIVFPGAGDRVRAAKLEGHLPDWGRRLFAAIFAPGEGTQVYNNLMNAIEHEGQHVLLTLGSTDPDFLSLPWEMMRDTRGPLVFHDVTIRRQLTGSRRNQSYRLGLPLRILLIVSRPTDVGFIDPRNSIAPMLDALDSLGPGAVYLDFCDPPTLAELEKRIAQARREKTPYHVVHFDGHGTYLPKTGVGALCFEDEARKNQLISARQFGDLVSRLAVPLVLLEACRGADLSDRPVFGSLAPALLEAGVGSVVAFSHSVHIKAARILVERFYRELSTGRSIGQALEEGRAALRADQSRFLHLGPDADTVDLQDWFIPQLYQVGTDPALRTTDQTMAPAPDRPADAYVDRLHGFPPEPLYRFHGRALELLDLQRALRDHPAVLVSGMGGMGKTALAREAAVWALRTGHFDRAVFCSFEERCSAERVVQILGQALEGDDFASRPGGEQGPAAIDLFRKTRVLLVWDNFESTLPAFSDASDTNADDSLAALTYYDPAEREQLSKLYRELTQGNVSGRLLVTCRPVEIGLPGTKEMELTGLKPHDALYLLRAVLDKKGISLDRPGYERAEIDKLLTAIQYHALSLELIGPQLKTLTPADILNDFGPVIGQFATGDAFERRNSSLLARIFHPFSILRSSAMALVLLS